MQPTSSWAGSWDLNTVLFTWHTPLLLIWSSAIGVSAYNVTRTWWLPTSKNIEQIEKYNITWYLYKTTLTFTVAHWFFKALSAGWKEANRCGRSQLDVQCIEALIISFDRSLCSLCYAAVSTYWITAITKSCDNGYWDWTAGCDVKICAIFRKAEKPCDWTAVLMLFGFVFDFVRKFRFIGGIGISLGMPVSSHSKNKSLCCFLIFKQERWKVFLWSPILSLGPNC